MICKNLFFWLWEQCQKKVEVYIMKIIRIFGVALSKEEFSHKKVFHYYLQFFSEIGSPISSRWDFHYKSQFSFFHHKSAETKVKGRFSHSIQFTFCGLNGTIGYIPRLADVSLFIEVLQLTSDKELLTHGALYTTPE